METCPHCGADLPANAKVCPECGSDEETGWSEQAGSDGLDLPDDHFDYAGFVKQEFGQEGVKPRGLHWFWWLVAVAIIVSFFLVLLRQL